MTMKPTAQHQPENGNAIHADNKASVEKQTFVNIENMYGDVALYKDDPDIILQESSGIGFEKISKDTAKRIRERNKAYYEEIASSAYLKYINFECGDLQFDGMPINSDLGCRKIRIENLFVPLSFRKEKSNRVLRENKLFGKKSSEDDITRELEKRFDELFGEDNDYNKPSNNPITDGVIRSVVLAHPGGGKTTFMKHIAISYAFPERAKKYTGYTLPERELFPIYLKCRNLNSVSDISIMGIIKNIPDWAEFTEDEDIRVLNAFTSLVKQHIKNGTALLLVDGLDEITDEQKRVKFTEQLRLFMKLNKQANVLITSRFVGFRIIGQSLEAFCDYYEIEPLNDLAIFTLCNYWYIAIYGEHKKHLSEATELVNTIKGNPRIRALAGNPLLLTTLLIVKMRVGRLPSKRVQLYEESIKLLLETWNQESFRAIDIDEAKAQLSYIAFEMMKNSEHSVGLTELKEMLKFARKDLVDVLPPAGNIEPIKSFLQSVEYRSSLLTKVGVKESLTGLPEAVYEFQHYTFQEYLCAYAIIKGYYRNDGNNINPENVLEAVFENDEWAEVILLATILYERRAFKIVELLIKYSQTLPSGARKNNIGQLLLTIIADEAQLAPENRYSIYSFLFVKNMNSTYFDLLEIISQSRYFEEMANFAVEKFSSTKNNEIPNFRWLYGFVRVKQLKDNNDTINDLLSKYELGEICEFEFLSIVTMIMWPIAIDHPLCETPKCGYENLVEALKHIVRDKTIRLQARYDAALCIDDTAVVCSKIQDDGTTVDLSNHELFTAIIEIDFAMTNSDTSSRIYKMFRYLPISSLKDMGKIKVERKNVTFLKQTFENSTGNKKIGYFRACYWCGAVSPVKIGEFYRSLRDTEGQYDKEEYTALTKEFEVLFEELANSENSQARELISSLPPIHDVSLPEVVKDEDELDNIIVLNDENGDKVRFEFLDLIEYEDEEYVVLLPVEESEDAGEVVILKVEESIKSDEESYVSVDDSDVLNAVYTMFKEKFKDEFNFTDES